jgi:competence protein ComEA
VASPVPPSPFSGPAPSPSSPSSPSSPPAEDGAGGVVRPGGLDDLAAPAEPWWARPWRALLGDGPVERVPVRLVAIAVVAAIGGAGIAWAVAAGGPLSGAAAPAGLPLATRHPPAGSGTAPGPSAAPGTTAADAWVAIAGAVVRPGLYRVGGDTRLSSLIAAAGGLTVEADGDRVNLAAVVHDGERVYVPRRGEPGAPPVVAGAGPGGGTSGSGGPAVSVAPGPVDLNRASADELDRLPGVGPATAQAIIDHRTRNGPFGSVDELADVRGIGPAKLEQLRPLVVVR